MSYDLFGISFGTLRCVCVFTIRKYTEKAPFGWRKLGSPGRAAFDVYKIGFIFERYNVR